MKQEQLDSLDAQIAALNTAASNLAGVRSLMAQYLPEDPPVPTGLAVVGQYGTNPLAILIGFDLISRDVLTPVLQYKAADDNPNGPRDWTDIETYSSQDAGTGATATLLLNNPDGRNFLIRLGQLRFADNVTSPFCEPIAFP